MQVYHLAVDLGASSGRHILGHVEHGRMVVEEVYRFANTQVLRGGHACWNLEALYRHLLAGLAACREAGKCPATVGIDTWGVDFVLLDAQGAVVGDAVAYRDERTQGVREALERAGRLSFAQHYAVTGIQYQPFNTAYQLAALRREHPEQLRQAAHLLLLPDYLHYRLTGRVTNEYTNATTTALVNARTGTWDDALLAALELPRGLFGPLSMPGTRVGGFLPEVQSAVGFDSTVVLPATHDTGSAFLAVPARDAHAAYLSSGTWSLLGTERAQPITTPESRAANFTNEGGYAHRWRYLKNIMGLWMLQSVRRERSGVSYVEGRPPSGACEGEVSYARLEREARACVDFAGRVDVSDARFLSPSSMTQAVKDVCAETGQPVPRTNGELAACIYGSLADSYAAAVRELSALTHTEFTALHIVGGGSRDGWLNTLTARATGLPVYAGPAEATALGNLMAQCLADGTFPSLTEARAAVRAGFSIEEVIP